MRSLTRYLLLLMVVNLLTPKIGFSQGGGLGAGAGAGAAYNAYQNQPRVSLQHSYANSSEFVAITGTAEILVKPESLRLVFAVTSEEKSSQACAAAVKASITKIQDGLRPLKIEPKNVIEDFIVVVPRYTWELAKLENREFVKEIPDGFRMQSNLHILCKDEAEAMAVMDVAFKAGVSEIVSFDYWHSDLDQHKREALKRALDEAKSKADILLTVFDQKPPVLNVGNSIKVSFPESLYKTISPKPAIDQAILPFSWNNHLKIRAHRPLTTFFAGSKDYSDSGPTRPAMSPEISVLSTVTLTYGSPARQERLEIGSAEGVESIEVRQRLATQQLLQRHNLCRAVRPRL